MTEFKNTTVPFPFPTGPMFMTARSLEEFKQVFQLNQEGDPVKYTDFFRSLSAASGDALRIAGNYHYNKLLRDHQRLMEDVTNLQCAYRALIATISNACTSANAEFCEVQKAHMPYPSEAWVGHPYGQTPYMPRMVPRVPAGTAFGSSPVFASSMFAAPVGAAVSSAAHAAAPAPGGSM
ncbi:hypothetical protein B0H12DRAFT_1074785 [Mycena haematopus]|nr:hypothetical protein B0H12DRAFT_1074785 [Mycena haematopus]